MKYGLFFIIILVLIAGCGDSKDNKLLKETIEPTVYIFQQEVAEQQEKNKLFLLKVEREIKQYKQQFIVRSKIMDSAIGNKVVRVKMKDGLVEAWFIDDNLYNKAEKLAKEQDLSVHSMAPLLRFTVFIYPKRSYDPEKVEQLEKL